MRSTSAGLGLVEFIIVLAVLGLLATVGLPSVNVTSPPDTHDVSLTEELAQLRGAIDSYWAEHDDFPGQDGALQLERQLAQRTNAAGLVGGDSQEHPLGPYVLGNRLPDNPLVDSNSVRIESPLPGAPSGHEAWIYDPASGQIRANLLGKAPDGSRLFDL